MLAFSLYCLNEFHEINIFFFLHALYFGHIYMSFQRNPHTFGGLGSDDVYCLYHYHSMSFNDTFIPSATYFCVFHFLPILLCDFNLLVDWIYLTFTNTHTLIRGGTQK
jgi:hypothetical protein